MTKKIIQIILFLILLTLQVYSETRGISPNNNNEGSIGRTNLQWGKIHAHEYWMNGNKITCWFQITNLFIPNMSQNDSTNINGQILGVYDDSKVEKINTFYCTAANSNSFTFESWKGDVSTLTVGIIATNGTLDAPLHSRIITNGACMVINGSNYWINTINSTNIGFSPAIGINSTYTIADIRAVELGTSLVNGRTSGVNGPFVPLDGATIKWGGIYTRDGIHIYGAIGGGYLRYSIDGGRSWNNYLNAGLRSWSGIATTDGKKIYACVGKYGEAGYIYVSEDAGETWRETSLTALSWSGIATFDGVILYATSGHQTAGYIQKSINGGTTWTNLNSLSKLWGCIATHNGEILYAGVGGYDTAGYIYKSVDAGQNWIQLNSPSLIWASVSTVDGVNVYAASGYSANGYIYKSSDGGNSWVKLSSPNITWGAVSIFDGKTVFAGAGGYNSLSVLYKSVEGSLNPVLNTPYTVTIDQSTNYNHSILDTTTAENNQSIYYSLKTKTNEWSIYDMTVFPNRWAVIAAATNGVDWAYRDTNNLMVASGTNELSTISMAIASNLFNRQRGYVYSTYLSYTNFSAGKVQFAATFFNNNASNPPSLQGITTLTTVTPDGYKWVNDQYGVYIDPVTHTNSVLRKESEGLSNVLVEYLKKVE